MEVFCDLIENASFLRRDLIKAYSITVQDSYWKKWSDGGIYQFLAKVDNFRSNDLDL